MKKVVGIVAAVALCIVGGTAVAKSPDATVDNVLAVGSVQVVTTGSIIAIAQPIEGQYSSALAVGVGTHSITGGTGHSITGGTGHSITGGTGHSITGGTGHSITGGTGHSITGGTGHSITGGTGHSITGGTGH